MPTPRGPGARGLATRRSGRPPLGGLPGGDPTPTPCRRAGPHLQESGAGLTVSGKSATYSGPLLKQPANDGSNPEPVDAGDGTISATCP
jgi:hypothetical protein